MDSHQGEENKRIISQHIFMFPFRISPIKETINNEKPSMREIVQSIIEGGWEYKPYKIDTCAHYSEYYYFHEYVRKAIFELRDCYKLFEQDKATDVISCYFERFVPNNSIVRISIKRKDKGNQIYFDYDLTIHHISLRLFSTNIGVLTIELYNYNYPLFQDIMYINEYARRVYPQFLPDNCDIGVVKSALLADKIEFKCGSIIDSVENFYPHTKFLNVELTVADYITELLGKPFTKEYKFIPIIDDRMFTVCWYVNADLIKKLQQKVDHTGKYKYEVSDDWYSFVFIDSSVKGVSAGGKMKEDLINRFTYSRWIHEGTLFGITRYSLMCLTNSTFEVLRHHMERMYYQMAIILLAQRASILKFSDDVSKISGKIESMTDKNEQEKFEQIADDVKKLHSSFIHFVNRLWFTEITPQEQGIEMYNMAVENMGLKEQLDELRLEIKELYEFVEMQYEKEKAEEDRKMNKRLERLNKIAMVFLPITVVASLFGMNLFDVDDILRFYSLVPFEFLRMGSFWQRALPFIILTIVLYSCVVLWYLRKKE